MSDIKYAYYESSIGYKITGKTTNDVLVSGGSKSLDDFYHAGNFTPGNYVPTSRTITINGTTHDLSENRSWDISTTDTVTRLKGGTGGTFTSGDITLIQGANTSITQDGGNITISSTDNNTVYTAGDGLTLTNEEFSLPVTQTGTGNVVSSVTQSVNGITVDKGITVATTAELGNYIPLTQKGVADGVATLDVNGLVPSAQLPSYVDDIIEAATKVALDALPAAQKVAGKIYVTLNDNKTFRWGGSAFVEVSSGAIGFATNSAYGIVKLYTNNPQGVEVLNVHSVEARTYGVQRNEHGQLVVNVPWANTDTNTTYAGSASIALSSGSFQRAALTGDVTANLNSNATTIADNVVGNTKLADMNTGTIKGRKSTGSGDPEDLTVAQVKEMLGIINSITTTHVHVGNNVTDKNIVHNWNTRRVNVVITDSVTFYKIDARIRMTTLNAIDIQFDSVLPNPIEITLTKMA